jgi:hypothetical protein
MWDNFDSERQRGICCDLPFSETTWRNWLITTKTWQSRYTNIETAKKPNTNQELSQILPHKSQFVLDTPKVSHQVNQDSTTESDAMLVLRKWLQVEFFGEEAMFPPKLWRVRPLWALLTHLASPRPIIGWHSRRSVDFTDKCRSG